MFSLFPTNTFELNDKNKRLIYLLVLPFAALLAIFWSGEFDGFRSSAYITLIVGAGLNFIFFVTLLVMPGSLQIIELLTYVVGVVALIALVQITVYGVVTTSADPRLLSDATNGFSMWMITMLGFAYFTLQPKQIMGLISWIIVAMLVMGVGNFFFIPPDGMKAIPYIFRWLNSTGTFVALALIFRWIGIQQKKQAYTDALTGLLNRYALNQILEQEIEYSVRLKKPFSVVLFDLDHFKRINDKYGHLEGDAVLVALSKLVRENIRKRDYIGRWGGEEFLLIMPDTPKDEANLIAERLREQIAENRLGETENVTASFGVAEYDLEKSLEETLKRVDDALYQAKESGRNQVVLL